MTPVRFMKFAGAFIGVFVVGLIAGELLFSGDSEFTEWDVALIDAGIVRPHKVKQVLALPSTVITTDTSGSPAIARQVVLKTEKDGEPFVAVLYEAKFILLDNLTVIDTSEVKDTTK